jgi:type III restriction enzyme
MFRQLDYQEKVLGILEAYLDVLKVKKAQADQIDRLAAENPGLNIPRRDFAADAWADMNTAGRLPRSRAAIPFSTRRDGCERCVPNAVLKVPTGGGKTWLAVSAVSRMLGRYLDRNTGFVLWIVPNEAIYTQTLKHLKDRDHPYRQALDRSAAGRVRIMEKNDRLDARDVEANLCIMLLMLQAANRETQESLTMFRDRGDVHGFVPPEGEQQAHKALIERVPNLAAYAATGLLPLVRDSLGNALRIIRPIVVLDEGHRAISDLAFSTLYGFNPCIVLELTATPRDVQPRAGASPRPARYANVLAEVTGRELDREGMIKMPLNLDPRQGTDWRATLGAALSKLETLNGTAARLRADTNRYIRPIMLVQVERTGAEQRESGHIHAEDVKEWLLTAGFDPAEIAIKTAEQNDLNQPENQDLLSPMNRVRAIITKQALQEGWDCPFAYVLCALAASTNLRAMTQLIGRILRQPEAVKTGVAELDECHVVTHHAATGDVVRAIKEGLERDGLGDLVLEVSEAAGPAQNAVRKIDRRPEFAATTIYLPRVLMVDNEGPRDLDYETDVLANINWADYDAADVAAHIPENAQAAESQLQRIRLSDDGADLLVGKTVASSTEVLSFDPTYIVRMISDIVLNPFIGWDIVDRLRRGLLGRGFDVSKLGALSGLILDELRKGLDSERSRRAEAVFKSAVRDGSIQFRLRLDGRNWRMPYTIETTEPINARQLVSRTGGSLQKSLFAPVYENEMNQQERDVAVYLDGETALQWWHRNVARTQYGLQGWLRAKIYPDFIFAVQKTAKGKRITVLETKGDQLDNLDTAYKRNVLTFLSDNFRWDEYTPAGQLDLIQNSGDIVQCTLILMSEWEAQLPEFLWAGGGRGKPSPP